MVPFHSQRHAPPGQPSHQPVTAPAQRFRQQEMLSMTVPTHHHTRSQQPPTQFQCWSKSNQKAMCQPQQYQWNAHHAQGRNFAPSDPRQCMMAQPSRSHTPRASFEVQRLAPQSLASQQLYTGSHDNKFNEPDRRKENHSNNNATKHFDSS